MASHDEATKASGGETQIVVIPIENAGHGDTTVDDGLGVVETASADRDVKEGEPRDVAGDTEGAQSEEIGKAIYELEKKKKSGFAYLTTKDFYIVLLLG